MQWRIGIRGLWDLEEAGGAGGRSRRKIGNKMSWALFPMMTKGRHSGSEGRSNP